MTGGLLLLVYAISNAPQRRLGDVRTISLLAASAALLVAFLAIETIVEAPLMPLRIFRLKTLAGANAVSFLLGASFFALHLHRHAVHAAGARLLGAADRARLARDLGHLGCVRRRLAGARHPRLGRSS